MPAFEAPHTFASSDTVLEFARAVVDHDSDHRLKGDNGVTCSAGCSACCSQAVPVSPAEVRSILAFIGGLDHALQRRFETRIEAARRRLAAAGLGPPTPPPNTEDRHAFTHRYFEAGVPCPLLTDQGTCGVRPVRPLACREYLVTSDPRNCTTLEHPQTVRLVSKRDAIGGFRAVSRAFGEGDIGTLAFELSEPSTEAPDIGPLSGPGVVQLLTSGFRPEL